MFLLRKSTTKIVASHGKRKYEYLGSATRIFRKKLKINCDEKACLDAKKKLTNLERRKVREILREFED